MEDCKRYLHGQMETNELTAFELQMLLDENFRKEVKRNLKSIHSLARVQIREHSEEVFREQERKYAKRKNLRYWGLAACLLLLATLSCLLLPTASPSMKSIFAKNYTFHHSGSRSLAGGENMRWQSAQRLYQNQEHTDSQQAIGLFESLLDEPQFAEQHGNEARLYLGISYLETGLPDQALVAFGKVEKAAVSFYGDAIWYSAMAQLQKEDRMAACQAFNRISADSRWPTYRRGMALDICKDLRCK